MIAPPEGFLDALGRLPEGAEIVEEPIEPLDVVVWFVTGQKELTGRFDEFAPMLALHGGLWIAWPKKSSKIPHDLSFEAVQGVGLSAGLVDNKSCAIDADWQALRFVYRKQDRNKKRPSL